MKIMCQEHYDMVVQYAESIGDKTFQECLEKLRQWRGIPRTRVKSNCTAILRPIRSFSNSVIRTDVWALSADWFITAGPTDRTVLSMSRFTAG